MLHRFQNLSNKFYWQLCAPLFSILIILLLIFVALNPPATPTAQAAEVSRANSMSAALSIGGAGLEEEVDAIHNFLAYRAHTVRIEAGDIDTYTLLLSGPANLSGPDSATITATDGKLGSAMADDTWGYSYGESNATANTLTYHPLTGSNQTIDSGTPASHAVNQTKNLVFAVKFGPDTTPGEYTADVTLSLIATPKQITYSVSYEANGGSGTTPTTQTATSSDDTYTFTAAAQGNLNRTNYTFLGWAETNNATTAQYTAGSSQITLSSSSPSKTLYAVWEKNKTLLDITNMNELTTAICQASTQGDSKSLKDTSTGNNGKSYIVSKLKDDNCWMTENMNNSTGRMREESAYGGYYSNQGSGSGGTMTGGNAISVCEHMGEGWKLPTQGQYSTLTSGLTVSSIQGGLYKFKLGGFVDAGVLSAAGNVGYYWSSTAQSGVSAYVLYFNTSYVNLTNDNSYYRSWGMPVRCLVRGS